MQRGIKKLMAFLAVCLLAVGISAMAHGAPEARQVKLSIGKAGTINLARPAADVLVANPAVADVGSLRANRLYVIGKAIGDTNVLVFDDEGNQLADIAIQVRADQSSLRETVHEFFPNEAVDVRTVNDSIVLRGEVSTPAVANQVRDLVGRFVRTQGQTLVDLMKVQGEQQVMLKVKVIEARHSLLREYGIQTGVANVPGGRLSGKLIASGSPLAPGTTIPGLTAATEFGGGALTLAKRGLFGPLEVDFEGLENHGLVNTLAEPTLTAISGETAGFLAGGEFPVPASRDSSGNITVQFKQFGVALNFIPTVLSSERISLQLTSEVSEKSNVDGITFGGITVPGISIRRAETTVEMGSGGTLMIAGLLKSGTTDSMNGLPGLSDLPIIGDLFKSKSFQRGESELVFLVTPYIVKPYAMQQAARMAAASPLPSEIITTGHAVSLSDLHSHRVNGVPSPAAVPTAAPSATPAGVPVPVPGVSPAFPLAPMGSRHSDASPKGATRFAENQPVNVIWDTPKPHKAASKASAKLASKLHFASFMESSSAALEPVEKAALPALPAHPAKAKAAVAGKPPVKAASLGATKALAPSRRTVRAAAKAASVIPEGSHPAGKTAAGGQNPLSQSFMNNLRGVYGNRVPSLMTTGAGVGYIVD